MKIHQNVELRNWERNTPFWEVLFWEGAVIWPQMKPRKIHEVLFFYYPPEKMYKI